MTSIYDDMVRRVYANRAYENPDERIAMHAAREIFLRTVHRLEPRVAGDLMGEPLDLYRCLLESPDPWLAQSAIVGVFENHPPEARRLRELIGHWRWRWRLEDDWCLRAVGETLRLVAAGYHSGDGPLVYPNASLSEEPFEDDELRFEFNHAGWQPTIDDWQSAERMIDRAFREVKKAYRQRVEAMCREAGLVKVARTRIRAGDHFEWLARHVACRENWVEIAAGAGVTDDAVSGAVEAKAALIELTLPKAIKTGRPPDKAA